MDHKEAIIQAAIALIQEKGEKIEEITVREICGRAGVGLGLINYHFENKEKLIELCVERMINEIVDSFRTIREKTEGLAPFERLDYLGNLTLTFLFEHEAVSKISILTDMRAPKEEDNTHRTYRAYLPLVAACRPEWGEETVARKTFCLISAMQQVFLRHGVMDQTHGVNLRNAEDRRDFHAKLLRDILGE